MVVQEVSQEYGHDPEAVDDAIAERDGRRLREVAGLDRYLFEEQSGGHPLSNYLGVENEIVAVVLEADGVEVVEVYARKPEWISVR